LETFHTEDKDVDFNVHGKDGPIHVSRGPHTVSGPEQDFMDAAISTGYEEIKDLQDFEANNGFSVSIMSRHPDFTL